MSKTCQKRVYGIESLHPGRNPWGELMVRGQKDESLNGCFKKTKHAKFPENAHFSPPDTHTYVCVSGGKKYSFFEKLGVLCFLEIHFSDLPFCLKKLRFDGKKLRFSQIIKVFTVFRIFLFSFMRTLNKLYSIDDLVCNNKIETLIFC